MSPVSLSGEAWRRLVDASLAAARLPGDEERSALFRALVSAADRPPPVAQDHPAAPLFKALEHQVRAWCCTTPVLRAKLTPGLETLATECQAVMGPPPPPAGAVAVFAGATPPPVADRVQAARRLPYRDDTFDPEPERGTGT